MFKVLVLQTLYTLSDEQLEYQLKDRLSLMRFVGLASHDAVPDAKDDLFARFDAMLRAKGWLAIAGQIVDATVIESASAAAEQDREGHDQRPRHAGPIGRWRGVPRSTATDAGRSARARQATTTRAKSRLRCPYWDTRTISASTAGTAFWSSITRTLPAMCGRHRLPFGGQSGPPRAPRPEAVTPTEKAPGSEDAGAHRPDNATRARVHSRVEHVFADGEPRAGLS
jgi:Transposase domain (DUF772)